MRSLFSPRRVALLPLLALALALLAPSTRPPARAEAAADSRLAAALAARLEALRGPGAAPAVAPVRSAGGWAFGTVARPAAAAGLAPEALLFLAEPVEGGWSAALEGEPGLGALLRRAPKGLLTPAEAAILAGPALAEGGQALLSLPWAPGEAWYLTGGPHPSGFDPASPWSSLDFAGGSGLVRAAREGVAYIPCPNLVKVYHPDGFQTGYYHLVDLAVGHGQPVARGAPLGTISEAVGCGGVAYGAHLHFWLMQGGADAPIAGHTIGGWTVQEGGAPYQGCMARGGAARCAGGGLITNDGTIGDGQISSEALVNGSFEAGESPAPWLANGPCAAQALSDPQRARDGFRALLASHPAGSGCLSVLQDVPGAPQPGARYRLAVWARSGDGAPRQAALALWALGGEPRVAAADLSLAADRWRCHEVELAPDAGHSGLRAELYLRSADGGEYLFDAAELARADAPLCPPEERYRAEIVGLEHPAALAAGASGVITATVRNIGSAAWDEATMLAPLPRDAAPELAAPDWPRLGERIMGLAGLAPGEARQISFAVLAPAAPGRYRLSLGLVQEGLAWFAEPGEGAAAAEIEVVEPPPPGDERLYLPLLTTEQQP